MRASNLWVAGIGLTSMVNANPVEDIYGTICAQTAMREFILNCPSQRYNCLCNDENFMVTVALCVEENSEDESLREAGLNYIRRKCAKYSDKAFTSDDLKFFSRNASDNADMDFMEKSLIHTKPIRLQPTVIKAQVTSTQSRINNDLNSLYYGSAMLGYMGLMMVIATLKQVFYKAFPLVLQKWNNKHVKIIKKHLLLPPTFSQSHSSPVRLGSYTFNIPIRAHTLILTGYFIINFIALFIYQFSKPTSVDTAITLQLSRNLSYRCGIIGATQVPLLVLFGGRNNIMLFSTGWSLDIFNVFHKWISRGAIINLIIHGVAFSINLGLKGRYIRIWQHDYWKWGVATLCCGGLILIQSLHYFRQKKYEVFLILHIFQRRSLSLELGNT